MKYFNYIYQQTTMKVCKSPTHRVIQLRRKNDKVNTNLYSSENKQNYRTQEKVTSKSKKSNCSSKNSLEKLNFDTAKLKPLKVKTKKDCKSPVKSYSSFNKQLYNVLSSMQKPQLLSYEAHLTLIQNSFKQITCTKQQQNVLVAQLKKVLKSWIVHSSKNSLQNQSIVSRLKQQRASIIEMNEDSGVNQSIHSSSDYTYIADPMIQIKIKSVRPDLRKQLQLNFSKIDQFRKRQLR